MTGISRQLIESFLNNKCTAEEAELVARYLEENPQVLEEVAGRQEWDHIDRQLTVPAELRADMRRQVYSATSITPRRIWLKRSLAAASVVGLLFLGGYAWINSARINATRDKKAGLAERKTSAPIPNDNVKTITNKTDDKMVLTTPDGSTIELAAHSEVTYRDPFETGSRDFRLKGVARFDVAKDPHRSFTVYAGGIATTALGTSFLVRAVDSESKVSVQLLSGKVSVRLEKEDAVGKGQQPLFLSPGDIMLFNKEDRSMARHSNLHNDPDKGSYASKGTTTETSNSWSFYNQPLPVILKSLQASYSTPIIWSDKALSGIRFTGSFNKSDSISYILNTLGSISKLHVLKEGDSYRVEK